VAVAYGSSRYRRGSWPRSAAADVVQRRLKTRLPWSAEGIWIVNCDAHFDDSKTRDELQLEPRPLRETFVDTVRWLVEAGHLTPREAGRIASPPV
jgi:nucleoside-diphosphate-sugar epimerase